MAAEIPDHFVKHTFAKYVWLRETSGEYMINTLGEAEKLYEKLLTLEGKNKFSRRLGILMHCM